jgi:hypothetical protein
MDQKIICLQALYNGAHSSVALIESAGTFLANQESNLDSTLKGNNDARDQS